MTLRARVREHDLFRVGTRRRWTALLAVGVLITAMIAGPTSRVGAQEGMVELHEVALSAGSQEGEYEIPRRPDVYVFGFIRDGSMMVPARPAAEAYGATVHWVAGVGTLVNGHLVETATVLGQAYSPARELARVLGCWLEWDRVARTVVLSNGIQRVIVSVPAGSWVEDDGAPGGAAGAAGGPGTGGGAGASAESGPGAGPVAGARAGTGSASAAGPGSGGSGLSTPGGTAAAGTAPGVIGVTPAAPGPGTPEAGPLAAAGRPGGGLRPDAPVVTIASPPSTGSPAASGSPGGSGGGAPVVVITPLPGPATLPGAGPGGDGADRRGPERRPSAGRIALTFDDGPDATYTKKILAVLERYHVKATFFLIGSRVERYPAVVRDVAAAGHDLGNHGYSHSRLTTLSAEAVRREISRTQEAVKAAANVTPRWFRPPYGSHNDEVRRIAKEEGAATVLWTLNPDDWRNPGQAAIVERVTSGAKDGAIVLLHVREQTARALPALIEGLTSQGYELVRLSDTFSAGDKEKSAPGPGGPADATGNPQGVPAGPATEADAPGGVPVSAGGVTDGSQAAPGVPGVMP
ncbi:MAG: polysaccharide deacetylase family protein [Bacillota bacterium]|nr:polysaccharide deacetylase family protein [Bacillota bacterium]